MKRGLIRFAMAGLIVTSTAFSLFAVDGHEDIDEAIFREGLRKYFQADYRSAIEDFDKAYAHNQKNKKLNRMYYFALVNQGDIEYERKNLPEARRLYARSLSITGENEKILLKLKTIDDINEHVRDEAKRYEASLNNIIKAVIAVGGAIALFSVIVMGFAALRGRRKRRPYNEFLSDMPHINEKGNLDTIPLVSHEHEHSKGGGRNPGWLINGMSNGGDEGIFLILARIIDVKTGRKGHSLRVANDACRIAALIGDCEMDPAYLKKASLVHDIGFLPIKGWINTEGNRGFADLQAEVPETIKSHTSNGANILRYARLPERISECVLYHHERFDGSGYPGGLSGERIPLVSLIVGAAEYLDECRQAGIDQSGISISIAESLFGDRVGTALISII